MSLSSSKINIVFLTDCLADLAGGAEKQIFELAKQLDKNTYSITIVSLECEGEAPRQLIESIGCRLIAFPVKRIYSPAGIIQGLRFFSFLRKNHIHILQTYHFSSDIWGTLFGRLARVKIIISNRRDMGFWRNQRHVLAYKFINRWVYRIVVVANAVKDLVIKDENVKTDKIQIVYNGVGPWSSMGSSENGDHPTSSISKADIGVKNDDLVIMHVANLRPVKGHSYLLQALAQIIPDFPKVKLVLIGDDTIKGTLQQLAQELKISNQVIFLGKRKDVRSLLKLADICVLPSLSEGMSNAILEYMAAGKPVVATRVGGNPELIQDRKHGLLVEKENAGQLRDALLALIRDPSQRNLMGENGRKRVEEEFTMSRMVQQYEQIYSVLTLADKKILHLISSVGLYGAENVLLLLAESFQKQGVTSYVGAIADARHSQSSILDRAKALGLLTILLRGQSRFDVGLVFRLCDFIKERKINILHTHNYKSDFIGLLAAKIAGIPIVSTAHGFTDMTATVRQYEQVDRFILQNFFKRVVVVSGRMLPNCPSEKKRVIPNGLDIAKFYLTRDQAAARKKFNINENDVVIGTVGRLSKEKNQRMLVEAFSQVLTSSQVSLKLMILGDGPEKENLQALVQQMNLSQQVLFAGFVKEMPAMYQLMDIFVLSSLTEGVPLTILEAMAASIPVIATKVGGIPEIITDEKNGLLVASGDIPALSSKIKILVQDKARRDKLAEQALAMLQSQYSLARMQNSYKEVYQEVLIG